VTLLRLAAGLLATVALFVGWEVVAGRRDRRTATVAAAEATALSLFAGLFFGSLGHGGWPLVFLLVGLLASGRERWLTFISTAAPLKPRIAATVFTAIRYIVAGGLLSLLVG